MCVLANVPRVSYKQLYGSPLSEILYQPLKIGRATISVMSVILTWAVHDRR